MDNPIKMDDLGVALFLETSFFFKLLIDVRHLFQDIRPPIDPNMILV